MYVRLLFTTADRIKICFLNSKRGAADEETVCYFAILFT